MIVRSIWHLKKMCNILQNLIHCRLHTIHVPNFKCDCFWYGAFMYMQYRHCAYINIKECHWLLKTIQLTKYKVIVLAWMWTYTLMNLCLNRAIHLTKWHKNCIGHFICDDQMMQKINSIELITETFFSDLDLFVCPI